MAHHTEQPAAPSSAKAENQALSGADLSFAGLRHTNVARCEQAFHPVRDWSPTDWATAMAGECGEACNAVKKLRRLQTAPHWHRAEDGPAEHLVSDVADELADLVIYADLLAERLGIDLGAAVVNKFNATSELVGVPHRLPLKGSTDPLAGLPVLVRQQAGEFLRRLVEREPGLAREGLDNFGGWFVHWDVVQDAVQRAWPKPRGYAESPIELVHALISERDELLGALREARATLVSAIEAGVDLPDFDPAEHVTVKRIDAAIRAADGTGG